MHFGNDETAAMALDKLLSKLFDESGLLFIPLEV
jgi:hypothetical protein